jgi:hypothetical protein
MPTVFVRFEDRGGTRKIVRKSCWFSEKQMCPVAIATTTVRAALQGRPANLQSVISLPKLFHRLSPYTVLHPIYSKVLSLWPAWKQSRPLTVDSSALRSRIQDDYMTDASVTKRRASRPPYVITGKTKAGADVVVCRISRDTARGEYILKPDVPQSQYVDKIALDGFRALPAGLKRSGAGLTSSNGYLILRMLSGKFGPFSMTLRATGDTRITKHGSKYHIDLGHGDLRAIQTTLSRIGSEKFKEQQNAVHAHCKGLFPGHFEEPPADPLLYTGGTLASVLSKRDILKQMSPRDIEELNRFFPLFIKKHGASLTGAEKLIALSKSKEAVEVIFLNRIVKRFEQSLSKRLAESRWQRFLSDYILIFNSNYARVLPKESVSLHGSYPDFILLDAYNYLDIYEIKIPQALLLRKDKSHNTYYWSPEMSRAISQTENYIAQAERGGSLLKEEIKTQKGIDIRVLKPRGFIIAGTRTQLKNESMQNCFRLLNNGLTNIEIILYDDLLNNLRTFLARIKEGAAKKRQKRARKRR